MLVETPEVEAFKLLRKYREKSLGIRCFSMHMYDGNREIRRKLMNDAISSMSSGRVRAPKSISFPLCDAVRVHELFEQGGSLGKMVLIP
jgi:NADPH2:quinone reductase